MQLGRDGHLRFLQVRLQEVTQRSQIMLQTVHQKAIYPFLLLISIAVCFSHQVSLDGEDSFPCCLTVTPPTRDHDRLGVAVLSGEIDLCVGLFTDL